MSRTRITSIIFIFSISFIFSSSFAADPIDSKISPVPTPSTLSATKDSKQTPNVTQTSGIDKKKNQDLGLTNKNNESKLDKKDKEKTASSLADPPISGNEKTKTNGGSNDKGDGLDKGGIEKTASCVGKTHLCRNGTLLACVQHFPNDSNDVSFLVQNVGEDILRVHINILPSVKHALPDLQLQKHESKMINATLDAHKSSKVILNAGVGECVFQLGHPVSIENFLQQLSIYSKQVTPLYGAYVFFLVALLSVGTWACCRFRKRRVQGGVQYQQLEMVLPNSASAVDVESAGGWDQDWDDDWDDDDTVKPSSHSGSISANGLTSRSTRTEGWENDWDD